MEREKAIEKAARMLRQSRKTVALTGAGVSTESGIPDFRSAGGLWARFDPMEYGTLGAFEEDPRKVWNMLRELIGIADAEPNAGHMAMAEFEKSGILKGIITQNIDMLHQKAGSHTVVEFHGSIRAFTCLECGRKYELDEVHRMALPPECETCSAILKPDVVFFDEQIPVLALQQTEDLLRGADLLLVAGTSCQVVPASMIPGRVRHGGGSIIEINKELALSGMAEISFAAGFSETMTALAEALSL
ncbi:MAG: NAD-dependent deacylase [Desulfobulbaceae bacterium]|uniref:protein acetyllysine N-acetyltransferase n=1 Tax=Candidatus Desulfobia pelagia TaxID=2841692 RepID=A0A8J6TC10_9BACT|nr:NAD-dependent deacylase [Candidatus Desulfobia pelagia]